MLVVTTTLPAFMGILFISHPGPDLPIAYILYILKPRVSRCKEASSKLWCAWSQLAVSSEISGIVCQLFCFSDKKNKVWL